MYDVKGFFVPPTEARCPVCGEFLSGPDEPARGYLMAPAQWKEPTQVGVHFRCRGAGKITVDSEEMEASMKTPAQGFYRGHTAWVNGDVSWREPGKPLPLGAIPLERQ